MGAHRDMGVLLAPLAAGPPANLHTCRSFWPGPSPAPRAPPQAHEAHKLAHTSVATLARPAASHPLTGAGCSCGSSSRPTQASTRGSSMGQQGARGHGSYAPDGFPAGQAYYAGVWEAPAASAGAQGGGGGMPPASPQPPVAWQAAPVQQPQGMPLAAQMAPYTMMQAAVSAPPYGFVSYPAGMQMHVQMQMQQQMQQHMQLQQQQMQLQLHQHQQLYQHPQLQGTSPQPHPPPPPLRPAAMPGPASGAAVASSSRGAPYSAGAADAASARFHPDWSPSSGPGTCSAPLHCWWRGGGVAAAAGARAACGRWVGFAGAWCAARRRTHAPPPSQRHPRAACHPQPPAAHSHPPSPLTPVSMPARPCPQARLRRPVSRGEGGAAANRLGWAAAAEAGAVEGGGVRASTLTQVSAAPGLWGRASPSSWLAGLWGRARARVFAGRDSTR